MCVCVCTHIKVVMGRGSSLLTDQLLLDETLAMYSPLMVWRVRSVCVCVCVCVCVRACVGCGWWCAVLWGVGGDTAAEGREEI